MSKNLGNFKSGALALAAIRAASLPCSMSAYLDMPHAECGTVVATSNFDDVDAHYESDGEVITATYDGIRRNRCYTAIIAH